MNLLQKRRARQKPTNDAEMRRAIAIAVSAATNRVRREAEAEMEALKAENTLLARQINSTKTG